MLRASRIRILYIVDERYSEVSRLLVEDRDQILSSLRLDAAMLSRNGTACVEMTRPAFEIDSLQSEQTTMKTGRF